MANYANAKATIAANIYTNHLGQVTAEMVKTAADAIVDTLIAGGYLYAGVAKLTPTQTNPGTPDANVFYIATEPGTYTNFVGAGGSLVVADGEVAVLKYNGQWSKETTGAATAAQVTELGQEVGEIPIVSVSQDASTGWNHLNIGDTSVALEVESVLPFNFAQSGNSVSFYLLQIKWQNQSSVFNYYCNSNHEDETFTFTNGENQYLVLHSDATYEIVTRNSNVAIDDIVLLRWYETKFIGGWLFQFCVEDTYKSFVSKYNSSVKSVGCASLVIDANVVKFTAIAVYYNDGSDENIYANSQHTTATFTFTNSTHQHLVLHSNKTIEIVGGLPALIEGDVILLRWINNEFVSGAILDGIIKTLRNNITELNGNITELNGNIIPIKTENGYLRPTGVVDYVATAEVKTYPCNGLDYVYVTGRQGSSSNFVLAAFYDSDGVFITDSEVIASYSTNYENYKIAVPSTAYTIKVASSSLSYQSAVNCRVTAQNPIIVPLYWESYLNEKIQTQNAKNNIVGNNGDSFIFITDIHEKLNFGNSPKLIDYIIKKSQIRKVIIGGDLWSDGRDIPAKSTLIDNLNNLRLKYNFLESIFAVRGNHDIEQSITSAEWYSMYERSLTEYIDTIGKEAYFYKDNVSQKIRYIFCDGPDTTTTIDSAQSTWLQNRISELESGWTVLVFCHSYWTPARIGNTPEVTTFGASIVSVLDGLVPNINATIAALITGHVHRDMNTTSTQGYAIIGTTCDANGWLASEFDAVTPDRVKGTTSEQVFDIFNIDTSAKKIYITRIGGNGSDREFTYL